LPREALKLLGLVAAQGLCGLEVVEVSPPYDTSDITALVGVRVWSRRSVRGTAADLAKLALLRVEVDSVADVGSITPHLGGASFRYDPLPACMVSRRKRLRLVYFDGQRPRVIDLAEALSLAVS
jgi:hypothetical protein